MVSRFQRRPGFGDDVGHAVAKLALQPVEEQEGAAETVAVSVTQFVHGDPVVARSGLQPAVDIRTAKVSSIVAARRMKHAHGHARQAFAVAVIFVPGDFAGLSIMAGHQHFDDLGDE